MTATRLAAVAALALVGSVVGTSSVLANTASAGTVTICHFAGHHGDFVTANVGILNYICFLEGGDSITVGIQACKNGHHAEQLSVGNGEEYGTCDGGDVSSGPPS